ncbi:hypothetical protein Tph_c00750 [Thermacetogenium phaeum DSM 12270]|uniref:Uncharacterized protein n=1 Tax=Thermacetogenium phaeum (strain ATCC BAA-254 / DSM 26808 / PB) TaxID=1089553 RepID=K4LQG8_THEPS|nr:hypothetical protein Tph_c00750 [Thermacetogenium phaeum DSM 12270]
MFIRIVRVRDLRYMQIAHNYYVSGGYPRQRVISSLGRYDEDRYRQIQDILRDMQKLKRMQEVIDEIKNPPILPGMGSCRRFRLRPGFRKG